VAGGELNLPEAAAAINRGGSAADKIERIYFAMRELVIRISSVLLLLFNGAGAVYGGHTLVSDPSGQAMGLPLTFLNNTPFPDYMIPGTILLVVLGGGSFIAILAVLLKARWYPHLLVVMGCALTIWILVQILMIRVLFYLQFVIGGIGIMLLVLGMIQRRSLSARGSSPNHITI
jgi:hypothetical protein